MVQGRVFQKFADESPLTVMVRVLLESIFPADHFCRFFSKEPERMQFKESLFSTVVDLMGLVAQIQSDVQTTCQIPHGDLFVTLDSSYGKRKIIKPNVPAEWVRRSAGRFIPLVRKMGRILPYSLSGYLVRSGRHILHRSGKTLKNNSQ